MVVIDPRFAWWPIVSETFKEVLKRKNWETQKMEPQNLFKPFIPPKWEGQNSYLVKKIDSIDVEANKKDFLKDFNEFSWETIDLNCDNILSIIAENYIKIPDSKWDFNKNADFSTAVKLSAMKILEKSPGINRDSEGYKKVIERINSWCHEDEYKWLSYLFHEWGTENWKRVLKSNGMKKITKQENDKKVSLTERFEELQRRFQKARKENNIVLLKDILVEAKELWEESVNDWDVFVASDLDVMVWEIKEVIWETGM